MNKEYYIVYFSGHGNDVNQGERDWKRFSKFEKLLKLGKEVSRFTFYSDSTLNGNRQIALNVKGIIDGYTNSRGNNLEDITFIIGGASDGGITALCFAEKIPNKNIAYLILADCAFRRGESEHLMNSPGSKSYHLNENYYENYLNGPDEKEIYGKVISNGWINYELKYKVVVEVHHRACAEALEKAIEKMENIISNGI